MRCYLFTILILVSTSVGLSKGVQTPEQDAIKQIANDVLEAKTVSALAAKYLTFNFPPPAKKDTQLLISALGNNSPLPKIRRSGRILNFKLKNRWHTYEIIDLEKGMLRIDGRRIKLDYGGAVVTQLQKTERIRGVLSRLIIEELHAFENAFGNLGKIFQVGTKAISKFNCGVRALKSRGDLCDPKAWEWNKLECYKGGDNLGGLWPYKDTRKIHINYGTLDKSQEYEMTMTLSGDAQGKKPYCPESIVVKSGGKKIEITNEDGKNFRFSCKAHNPCEDMKDSDRKKSKLCGHVARLMGNPNELAHGFTQYIDICQSPHSQLVQDKVNGLKGVRAPKGRTPVLPVDEIQ